MATARRLVALAAVLLLVPCVSAQFAEQNVNMVAGTDWPKGDPFLQRQNEPSVAVSTRNPLHLLAGANDYRTVDVPFDTPAGPDNEERGDAWMGVFKSRNGGQSWWSNLLDGYPQQVDSTSPLHGYQAAADAVVRSGPHGMFYFGGIVLNRDPNPLGGVFVARFIDNNNTENGDPFAYLGAAMVDKGTSGAFLDKPWIAVGPGTGTCTVSGQTFPAQNVYLAYTIFVGGDNNIRTKLMFTRSTNCGATWSASQKLSEGFPINQGAQIVVSPTGPVYVVWRRFKASTDTDAILIAKSVDQGQTFTKGAVVRNIVPFEQGMTFSSIRTNAYPAAAVDANGRLYVVWADRGFHPNGDGRIVMMHSADGVSWTGPFVVDPEPDRGHQFMPTITTAGGKVAVAYYDLRDDSTRGLFENLGGGKYSETRDPVGDRLTAIGSTTFVFTQFLQEHVGEQRRHTLELHAAHGTAGIAGPTFDGFARLSRYVFGSRPPWTDIEQLQFNVPNLPLFRLGTAPFIGDYIDMTGYSPKDSPVYHVVWTDNRDVRPPLDGNWANYTPVQSDANTGPSKFNGQTVPPCVAGQSGMRNQNIYTTRVTEGVFAGSAGNSKPLNIQRTFAVFVQNTKGDAKAFRLSIPPEQQPPGGQASFGQAASPLVDSIDVPVPGHSTATRTVYITSSNLHATVNVDIVEISTSGSPPAPVPNGLTTAVVLNPDVTNPDVTNPDVTNPDVTNPDVTNPDVTNPDVTNSEVHNPDVTNPDVTNPDVTNPDVTNPDVTNPDVTNPDVTNPDVTNPDVTNPDVTNPDVTNPDVTNGSVSDTTWTTHNKGNTTSAYGVKLVSNTPVPDGVKMQLITYRIHQTPIASNAGGFSGCDLTVQKQSQIISNILDPVFTDAGLLTTPDPNDATLWLAPGDAARITLRVYGAVEAGYDPAAAIAPVVVAQAKNNLNGMIDEEPSFSAPLFITTPAVDDAVAGVQYTMQFNAIGGIPPYTWTSQPQGIDNSGLFTHTFGTSDGPQTITVVVSDSADQSATKQYVVNVFDPLQITTANLPTAIVGTPYTATMAAQGGKQPYSWSDYKQSFNNTPFALSSAGVMTGAPATLGTRQFNFQVTDSASPSQVDVQSFDLVTVNPLQITTNALPLAVQNTPYTFTLSSSGGLAPVQWSLVSGALPAEFQFGSDGTISGTTSQTGTFSLTVRATDSSQPTPQTPEATLQLIVAPPGLTFDVVPVATAFSLDGTPVPINGTVTNATNSTQAGIAIQHWIDQGNLTIAAAGWLIIPAAGGPLGTVPPMTVLKLAPDSHDANAGFAIGAGMQPGAATLRIQLKQGDAVLQTITVPIELTP